MATALEVFICGPMLCAGKAKAWLIHAYGNPNEVEKYVMEKLKKEKINE